MNADSVVVCADSMIMPPAKMLAVFTQKGDKR